MPARPLLVGHAGLGLDEAQRVMLDHGHLRLPVYDETIDQVVGVLLARDLWRGVREGVTDLGEVTRRPTFVPTSRPVEDLIEEIVGEIQDEHEQEPLPFEEAKGEVRRRHPGERHSAGNCS